MMISEKLEQIAFKDGKFVKVKDMTPVDAKPYGKPFAILVPRNIRVSTSDLAFKYLDRLVRKIAKELEGNVNAYTATINFPDYS